MRIVILGPGAIGCLMGGLFSRAGHDVSLLDYKPERAARLNESGLTLRKGDSEFSVSIKAAVDPQALGAPELIIFCVKAFSTEAAARHAAPCVGKDTTVLTLQNGLGNLEILRERFGQGRVIAGTTGHGATLEGAGRVVHTGGGDTVLGEPSGEITPRLRAIKAAFDSAGLQVALTEDLSGALWGKAVTNSAINPVAAITKLKNGQLLEAPFLPELMDAVARESAGIAAALGIGLPYADAPAQVRAVCQKTAPNTNSMLADVLARRPTEIGQINAAIAAAAQKIDRPAPLNFTLTALVKALEAGYV